MIPEGWTTRLFPEVADYRSGRTPARANPDYWKGADDGVPWLSISDMTEFGVVSHTKERITNVAFGEVFGRELVPAGTLLMSFKLTIGRVATLGIDACHNEAIIAIYPRKGIDQRYLGYFLGQVDYEELQDRQVKGNTLNRDKINRIQVLLPPQEEQSSIADTLAMLRRSISLQDQLLTGAQALKRAAMQKLFTRGLRGEAQKETEIGPVPHSWELVSFASVRENLQYGTSVRCTYDVSERPVLRIPNIEPQRVTADDLKYCGLTGDDADKYQLEDGDLIFIRTNGVLDRLGSCAVYDGNPANALFASYLIRAKVKKEYVIPHFPAAFFASELGTSIVAGRAISASDGKFNLNTAAIDSLLIPLPPTLSEQRDIVAVLDAIDRKTDLHRRKRALLEDLFKVLLIKLMTGEIRVRESDSSMLWNGFSTAAKTSREIRNRT